MFEPNTGHFLQEMRREVKNASRGAKNNGRPAIKYLTKNFTALVFIFIYVSNNAQPGAEREMTAVYLSG